MTQSDDTSEDGKQKALRYAQGFFVDGKLTGSAPNRASATPKRTVAVFTELTKTSERQSP